MPKGVLGIDEDDGLPTEGTKEEREQKEKERVEEEVRKLDEELAGLDINEQGQTVLKVNGDADGDDSDDEGGGDEDG